MKLHQRIQNAPFQAPDTSGSRRQGSGPRRILITHKRSPGDVVVLTALVRDLKLRYGDQLEIGVRTSCESLWDNNPHITRFTEEQDVSAKRIEANYGHGLQDQKHRTIHFLAYFHEDFARIAGMPVELQLPYPDLHLSIEERTVRPVTGRYWVVFPGGKPDATVKIWGKAYWQEVVYKLQDMGLGVVHVGGKTEAADQRHINPELAGVLSLVGRTSLRQLLQLIWHADGVICGITSGMHIAAALHRPCVVVGGGREAWWWEAYVRENVGLGGSETAAKLLMPHRYLHTIGLLECCQHYGCWKDKVLPAESAKEPHRRNWCKLPTVLDGQSLPQCMLMITPEHVMAAVKSYYTDKSLPPIDAAALPPQQEPAGDAQRQPTATTPTAQPQVARLLLPSLRDGFVPDAAGDLPYFPPDMSRAEILAKQAQLQRAAVPAVVRQPARPPTAADTAEIGRLADDAVFDHDDVGGAFTIFMLMYGDYYDMHSRGLSAITNSVPAGRMDLRIGSNQLGSKSLKLVDSLVSSGICSKHYYHPHNNYKYPVMREMFHDPEHPIQTKWVIWFDDDTMCDRNTQWLRLLAETIVQRHRPKQIDGFGDIRYSAYPNAKLEAIKKLPWYRGRPFRTQNNTPSPNGNCLFFLNGSFWALTTHALKSADIPCHSLRHLGGDVLIGEQLYQAGFQIGLFNPNKSIVECSAYPRRMDQPQPFPSQQ